MKVNTERQQQCVEKTKKIKKSVFLWGWYGFENLGDDLLLYTMLKHLHGDITVPIQKLYVLPDVTQVKRSYGNLLRGAFFHDAVIIGPGGLFPFDNKAKVMLYYMITVIRLRVVFCSGALLGI